MSQIELAPPSFKALRLVHDWLWENRTEAELWPAAVVRDMARLLEAHQANAWRPIETAPKDGSAMLLYPCGIFGATSPDIGYWDRDAGYEAWRTLDRERIEPVPTHWMPLPEPPPVA